MKRLGNVILRHLKLYGLFFRNSFLSFVEYPANFYASITMELLFLASKLVYVVFVYALNTDINGISPDQMLFFTGSYTIMVGIYTGLFMDNFWKISGYINDGAMDIYMTKPVSALMLISMQHINYAYPLPNLAAGIVMTLIGVKRLGYTITLWNVAEYLLILLSCTIVMYCLFLIPQLISFWTVKSGAVMDILDRSWDLNNMPMSIYGKWFRRIGTFVFPILMVSNFPAMYWLGQLSHLFKIWVIIAPVIFLMLLNITWRFASKKYVSASS